MTSANISKNSSSLGVSRCKPAQSPKKTAGADSDDHPVYCQGWYDGQMGTAVFSLATYKKSDR